MTAIDKYFHVDGGVLSTKDYLSYSLSGYGQNLIFGIMNGYLMVFYTDIFLIPSQIAGTMFLVAKLWDAINDPIMGTIMDKTRTKWGKMRPYLLFSPIPICIVTILLFIAPDLSLKNKIIYMYVTYIAWGMLYTICDVPYWSLSSVLTPHAGERTKLVSFTRMITGAGMGTPMVLISLLMALKGTNFTLPFLKTDKNIYLVVAIFSAVVGAGLLSLGFFGTKERVPQNKNAPTFKKSMGYLIKNKPLMLVLLCNILAFPKAIQGGAVVYVAKYVVGGSEWVLYLGIPATIAGFLAFLFVPGLVKKFGAIKAYIYCNIVSVIPMVIMYFTGPKNIPVTMVLLFAGGLIGGIIGIIPTLLIADCVDFMEWKTGTRNEGVSFSVQTFMAKFSGALQSWVMGLMLVAFAFVQPITINGEIVDQIQSASTINGFWAMYTIIPAVGSILCAIPLFFYDLKGKKLEKIRSDLEISRAERAEAEEAIVK